MRRKAFLPAAAVVVGLLTACAVPLLSPDQRKEICQVVVDEKFGPPVFEPNVLSNPAGGLTGAGLGALGGLAFAPSILMIFTIPIGAAIGAAGGTACGIASLTHPSADADFVSVLRAADIGVLARAVETEFNAPRAECVRVRADRASTAAPDGVIEIEKVRVGMGCVLGQMEYWIAVDWRTVNLRSKREINSTLTRCAFTSTRNVDDWFADRGQARHEIEKVLAATGRRMVLQLLAQDVVQVECRLRANDAGEIKAR
jgi:hypothetical protein